MQRLESITPKEATTLYLEDRQDVSQSTRYEHKCRLNRFLEWCDETGFTDMTELTGRKAVQYRLYRSERVATITLEHEMRTFRLFLKFCQEIDAVANGIASDFKVPKAKRSERSRSVKLDEERAAAILNYNEKFHYASRNHVLFAIVWDLGCRTSGVRALDLEDFHADSPDGPFLSFKDRPETGTPLKNDWRSERNPPISNELATLIQDYIETNRVESVDQHGRKPLLTTQYGRMQKTTIQRTIYGMTRPCAYGNECPHDQDPDTCDFAHDYNEASKCESSRSPHTMRRGAATRTLNDGMPQDMVSDRMDMSPEVLNEHYNEQTENDKRRLQREFLDQL